MKLSGILFAIPAAGVVAVVFVVSALETAVILGIFLPAEVTVVLGGALAALDRCPLPAILAASVAGPIAGDVVGYHLGKRYGEAIVRRKLGARRWERAHAALTHRAVGKIALARLIPFVRGVLPTTAGAVGVPPLRFFAIDLPTAAVWGAGSALAGYVVGRDYEALLAWIKHFSIAFGVLVLAAAGFWWWKKMRDGYRKGTTHRRKR